MKAATYITQIRHDVAEAHGGTIPPGVGLTIRRYAESLELCDFYKDIVVKSDGMMDSFSKTTGIPTKIQHPMVSALNNQENACQRWAKMLGLTAAKAAVKTEDAAGKNASSSLDEFIDGIKG